MFLSLSLLHYDARMDLPKLIRILPLAFVLVACDKNEVPPPVDTARSTNAPTLYLDHALPKLTTIKLWIGAQEMNTELAVRDAELATGMMYRKEMGTNDGMLFIFGRPHRAAFYMRNTIVPLSAAYIDREGTILEIHDLKPLDETPIEANSDKVQYVLETPQGWFKRNNIGPGTVIRTERGSLQETFFGR
jgi:uncharacterized protein